MTYSIISLLYRIFALMLAISICSSMALASANELQGAITITAQDEAGYTISECYLHLTEEQTDFSEWASYLTGDLISLEYPGFLSVTPYDELVEKMSEMNCEGIDPAAAAAFGNSYAVLRSASTTTPCPFPMYPAGLMFMTELDDGRLVFLRVQNGHEPARVIARCGQMEYEMDAVDRTTVAEYMLSGDLPDHDYSKDYLEVIMARQECLNLISYKKGSGQLSELNASADIICKLLDLYYRRYSCYPNQLCQLYTGNRAVIGGFLSNPYQIANNLCISNQVVPRPLGAITYYPEAITIDGHEQLGGYWLIVQGPGETTDPIKPLPPERGCPLNAIRWIEVHQDS